jgi:hypothetical protein
VYESVTIQVCNVETCVLACGHTLLTDSYENKHMFGRQRCWPDSLSTPACGDLSLVSLYIHVFSVDTALLLTHHRSPVLYNSGIFQHNVNIYYRRPHQPICIPLQTTIIAAKHTPPLSPEQTPFDYFLISTIRLFLNIDLFDEKCQAIFIEILRISIFLLERNKSTGLHFYLQLFNDVLSPN